MTKDEEIMNFLHERVFTPILNSPTVPKQIKQGTRLTIARMNQLDHIGKIKYYWSAIVGTERSINFASILQDEGLVRFEEVIDEFREHFSDQWLRR